MPGRLEIEPLSHELSIDQHGGMTVESALDCIERSGNRILSV
jgi:hypothetical protein